MPIIHKTKRLIHTYLHTNTLFRPTLAEQTPHSPTGGKYQMLLMLNPSIKDKHWTEDNKKIRKLQKHKTTNNEMCTKCQQTGTHSY